MMLAFSGCFPGYEFKISGKPYFSLPANIPVTFEVIVLSSAFAAFLGMWALNGLASTGQPIAPNFTFQASYQRQVFLDDRGKG